MVLSSGPRGAGTVPVRYGGGSIGPFITTSLLFGGHSEIVAHLGDDCGCRVCRFRICVVLASF